MEWTSVSHFLSMGGHGYFVWMSYGMMTVLCVAELVLLAKRRKDAAARIKREATKLRKSETRTE